MRNKKEKAQLREILRFLVTGAVCFAVELIILVMLKELVHMDVLLATPIAFLISVSVNYLMCVAWVFKDSKKGGRLTQIGFLITSAMGLLLNEILMLLFRLLWGEETVLLSVLGFAVSLYMINKALATLIVMIWNYFTKRAMLKKRSA